MKKWLSIAMLVGTLVSILDTHAFAQVPVKVTTTPIRTV